MSFNAFEKLIDIDGFLNEFSSLELFLSFRKMTLGGHDDDRNF